MSLFKRDFISQVNLLFNKRTMTNICVTGRKYIFMLSEE